MTSSRLGRCGLGLATVLALGVGAGPPSWAQDARAIVQGLEENQGLIRQCRRLNQATEVFDNTSLGPLSNRLGTLPAGTRVSLTGVVAQGRAQIFLPNNFGGLSPSQPVGWISAGRLTSCGGPSPTARACFRANLPLQVRLTPSTSARAIASYNPGDTIYASTNPPTRQTPGNGYTWLQVTIYNGNLGWVPEVTTSGQIQDITATACP